MRRTLMAALLLVALALQGCGATGQTAPAPPPGSAARSAAGPAAGPAAAAGDAERPSLAFSAQTLQGAAFDGATLAGRPAVLWFWAPWCPTCRAQSAGVARLAQRHGDDVSVVAVGGLADVADIRDVAGRIAGPVHLVDPEGLVWRHFGVTAQSTYLVLDADGAVVARGYLDDDDLAATVARLAP